MVDLRRRRAQILIKHVVGGRHLRGLNHLAWLAGDLRKTLALRVEARRNGWRAHLRYRLVVVRWDLDNLGEFLTDLKLFRAATSRRQDLSARGRCVARGPRGLQRKLATLLVLHDELGPLGELFEPLG